MANPAMEMYVRKLEAQNKALAAQVLDLEKRMGAPAAQIAPESDSDIPTTILVTKGNDIQTKIMTITTKFFGWILGMKIEENHG